MKGNITISVRHKVRFAHLRKDECVYGIAIGVGRGRIQIERCQIVVLSAWVRGGTYRFERIASRWRRSVRGRVTPLVRIVPEELNDLVGIDGTPQHISVSCFLVHVVSMLDW